MHLREMAIRLTDAWNGFDDGYNAMLEIGSDSTKKLRYRVNGEARTVLLDENEVLNKARAYIDNDWNLKYFDEVSEDGWHWYFMIAYDDVYCTVAGHNCFPDGIGKFIRYLQEAGMEKDKYDFFGSDKRVIKNFNKKGLIISGIEVCK